MRAAGAMIFNECRQFDEDAHVTDGTRAGPGGRKALDGDCYRGGLFKDSASSRTASRPVIVPAKSNPSA